MPAPRYFRPRVGQELTEKERKDAEAAKVYHAAAASLAPQSHDDYSRMYGGEDDVIFDPGDLDDEF